MPKNAGLFAVEWIKLAGICITLKKQAKMSLVLVNFQQKRFIYCKQALKIRGCCLSHKCQARSKWFSIYVIREKGTVQIFVFDILFFIYSTKYFKMQNHDILIQEIEGIDDYLGPTFRYVFSFFFLIKTNQVNKNLADDFCL